MKSSLVYLSDKAAIGLSLLCTLHCLALPVIIVALPSLGALGLDDESFHEWMLAAVIPLSIFAISQGCRKHKNLKLILIAVLGLAFLIGAVMLEHWIGELGEKLFTLIGASIIAYSHYCNYRLCQKHDQCECPGANATS